MSADDQDHQPEDQPSSTALPELTERVLRYFQKNPAAMDSVEGIARFWVHEGVEQVERCLADLHARGLLSRRTIAGTAFYSLEPASPPPAGPAEAASEGGKRGRILVVDDEPQVRGYLVEALREAGHQVTAAESGHEAIALLRADPCDLVVTDVVMPGLSGLQVLEAAKRQRPTVEVLVVTGYADLQTALEALRHGAYDLIPKPITDLEALYRAVDRALERQRLAEETRLLVTNLQGRNRELRDAVTRFAAVNEIGAATTGLLDLHSLYGVLVRVVAQHLRARRVSVLVTEPGSDIMTLVASVGITAQEVFDQRVRIGEGIAGRVAATQSPLLVPDIDKTDFKHLRTGATYATGSFMITPLRVSYPIRYQRRRIGVINVSDKHTGDPFDEQDLELLAALASQMAVAIENARLVKEMEEGYLGIVARFVQALEDTRPPTRGHSKLVTDLVVAVARAMELEEPRVAVLMRAAALHEVGRLLAGTEQGKGGPKRPQVLRKWDPEAVMATERILSPIASLRAAREVILHSWARFDAAPVRIGEDQFDISAESQILAVCEEYARLLKGEAKGREPAALEAIRKGAGSEFAPDVVDVLSRVVSQEGPS